MIPYTHQVCDDNGTVFIDDFPCLLEVEVIDEGGDPKIEVTSVWFDGVEMITNKSPTIRAIGCAIAGDAADDSGVLERALEDSGKIFDGAGANDPSGRFRRVA